MLKVLVVTGILPIERIERKKNENDIVLEYERQLLRNDVDVDFRYLFTLPYSNRILGLFSKKWKSYSQVQHGNGTLNLLDKVVYSCGILMIPGFRWLDKLFYGISFFLNQNRLCNLVEEFQPDIIHAQNANEDAYIARRISLMYNLPYVVTLRSLRSSDVVLDNLRGAKSLIAISPSQLRKSAEYTNRAVNLIPHGVDQAFYVSQIDINKNKSDIDTVRFVTVCRLIKLKNIHIILLALSKFRYENFIYDIYGDGPEFDSLNSAIDALGLKDRVFLKGHLHNTLLPSKLVQYDLFVLLSYPETLGRVYLEAMACGLPVVASKGTGIDGLIEHGNQGFLVDTKLGQSELERLLGYVFDNPACLVEMGRRSKVLSRSFSWKITARKVEEVYNSAVRVS